MKNVVVLLVMSPSARRRALINQFAFADVEVLFAGDCRRAREVLGARADIDVAVTDLTLSDGNWRDVLEWTVHRDTPPPVVVVSPVGGERLWAEVLWRGAHDLLVEPVEGVEIRRSIEGAVRGAFVH